MQIYTNPYEIHVSLLNPDTPCESCLSRSHLLRDTEPALQSLKSQLCSTIEAVSRDVKTHKTEMAQETSQLQSGRQHARMCTCRVPFHHRA